MPQPTLSDVHVNVPLTQISIAYIQQAKEFIATKVFPMIPVNYESDRYYEYLRDAFFRNDVRERAPGTESQGTGYTLQNTSTYTAKVYALHDDVPDQVRANSDSVLQPDVDAVQMLTQQMMINRELVFLNTFFNNSSVPWTTTVTGVAGTPTTNQFKQWDQAGSTPIEDVRTQALVVKSLTGFRPNKLVLGPYVANQLINNPEIVDRVKYTQLGFLDYQLLAQAFGVDEVLVPEAVQNTAAEGATLSNSFIYGKHALLVYSAPAPGLRVPSGGYTFGWKAYLGGTVNTAIAKFRMQHLKSDRIEAEQAFAMKVIGPDLGVWFAGAVS